MNLNHRIKLAAPAGLAAGVLLAFGTVGAPDKAEGANQAPLKATVTLKNYKFSPSTVKIRKGGTVTWKWNDGSIKHDVSGTGFKSKIKKTGTYKHTFNKKGTFSYRCTLHANMKAKVKVS